MCAKVPYIKQKIDFAMSRMKQKLLSIVTYPFIILQSFSTVVVFNGHDLVQIFQLNTHPFYTRARCQSSHLVSALDLKRFGALFLCREDLKSIFPCTPDGLIFKHVFSPEQCHFVNF